MPHKCHTEARTAERKKNYGVTRWEGRSSPNTAGNFIMGVSDKLALNEHIQSQSDPIIDASFVM